jgi:hypothetical protein
MRDLYAPEEFDAIPAEARVLEVVVKWKAKAEMERPVVFLVTSRAALDMIGKRYGSYEATVVRDGTSPWDSQKSGII